MFRQQAFLPEHQAMWASMVNNASNKYYNEVTLTPVEATVEVEEVEEDKDEEEKAERKKWQEWAKHAAEHERQRRIKVLLYNIDCTTLVQSLTLSMASTRNITIIY